MKFLFKAFGFLVDDDSPVGKVLNGLSLITFFSGGISTLVVIVSVLLIVLVPAIFLGASSSDDSTRDEAVALIELYENVVSVDIPEHNQNYIDEISSTVSHDSVEVNDYSFVSADMLIAVDSVLFEQDYSSINRQHILSVVDKLITRSYDTVVVTGTETNRTPVSYPSGGLIPFDDSSTILDELEEDHEDGYTEKVGNVTYFYWTSEVEETKLIITISSLSFDSLLDSYGFTDIQRELAMSYLQYSAQSVVAFSGEVGNYKILDTASDFIVPVEVSYPLTSESYVRVTSPFGYREFMYNGRLVSGNHNGIDIGLPTGTPLVSTASGVVTHVGTEGTYGLWVQVDHGNGFKSRYAHLSLSNVVVGQSVDKGERVALSGNSGRSTGAHLHFEIRKNNIPLDPLAYINLVYEQSN